MTRLSTPTHLHSHLLFCNRTDQPQKSKRECKPTHPDSATVQCKLGRIQHRTDRRAADNKGFKEIGGSVVGWSFVLPIKFSVSRQFTAPKPQLLKPPKRCL